MQDRVFLKDMKMGQFIMVRFQMSIVMERVCITIINIKERNPSLKGRNHLRWFLGKRYETWRRFDALWTNSEYI